jgi:hypothetical protein
MNSPDAHYQHKLAQFARSYVDVFTQGETAGRVQIILRLLEGRYGPLSDMVGRHVRAANFTEHYCIADRVLTATTLREALAIPGITAPSA